MLCMVLLALASGISTMEKNENLPRMVLLQLLILVVSSQDTLPHNHPHQCIHDKVSEKPLKIALNTYNDPPLQNREKRNADTEEYQPIRITTILIPENLDLPSVTGENGSLTQAIEFISQALSVRPAVVPILFTPLCIDETNNSTRLCEEGDNCTCTNITTLRCGPYATVPDQHIGLRNVCSADGNCSLQGPNGTGISDTDFVLYVTATDQGCEGNFEEPGFGQLTSFDTFRNNHFDSFCLIDPGQKNRPVAGWINICPPRRQPPETGPSPSVVNRKDSIVRQLVRMLGFSQSLFPFFDVKGGPVVGSEIHDSGLLPAIVTPKVVEVARQHFGCPYINGLYIYGSHWETRLLQPEVMANRLYPLHSYLSQFTLALLEDSGWYKANYSVSERTIGGEYMPFLYGKNLGCSFIYEECGGFRRNPYRCFLGGCTYDGKYKGQCLRVEENSFCVLAYPTTSCTVSPEKNVQPEGNFPGGIPPFPGNFGGFDLEVFGNNSLCFLSSLVTQTGNVTDFSPTVPRCYGIQPASDGMRYGYSLITAKNNGTASLDLSCKNSGEIVMANDGSIAAGVIYCAHNEAVEFLFPPESVGSEFQAPLCDRTCSSCTKIDDPTACLDCSVPNVFPDSAPPSTCSRARSSTLVNGTLSDDGNFFSGRIQVQFDGMLDDDTTFCVDTVNQTLAEISCLTVEYATVENAFLGQGGVFGEGRGEIYDRFECDFSDEDRFKSFTLVQCPVMNKTNTCDHSMDAGLACSGRQLNKNELIGYPFTTLNGYKEITGCRDCPFSSGQSQFRIRSRPFPNCTKDCPQMVATPYPMKLFDDKDNYTYIRVGTYGGLHFLPYILPNNSESPFVEFTPYAELFDTVYQGSVFYKSIKREEDPLLFNRIDGVIADSSITPPSFSFFSTYAFIATWTNVTICCTPKEEINTFQAIVASNGEFTFGIAAYPRDGLQSIQRNLFQGVAIYGTQEILYSFGYSSIGFSQLPVNTKNYGQVVLRIDSRDPIPVDTDQDGVDDNVDPCIGCCVSDFSLGVQWPQTVQGGTARMSCSILDSSFTPGSVFTRTCFFNSLWSSVDLTSCTFSAGAANPILTHSVTGFFFSPNVTIDVFINEYSGALESAGITNATVTSLGGLQAVTEATYSSILNVEFLLETFDEDLVVTFVQSLDPRRKKRAVESIFQTIDAFGFVPSTMCTCTNVTSSEVFTSVCSGAPQNPCQCTTSSCQCVDPFVPLQETNSSSLQCSLDSEGDTIADPEDNCPDVYSIDNTCPSAQSLTGVSCPEEFDEEWGFMWKQTAATTIAGQRCQLLLDGPIVSGSVTRTCSPTGEWQMVNTTQCQSQVITDVRDEILRITNLGRPLTVFEQQEVQMLSQQLNNATSESVLFPADLQSVNVYLDSVSELFENGNVLPDRGVNITTLLAISSNVLDNRFQQGWTTLNDETRPNGASQLLLNVERIASIAANAVTQAPRLPSTQAMQLDNIILDVRLVDTRAAGTDVTVGNNQVSGSNLTEEELPIITVPSEVLVPVGPSPMVPVTTVVFRNLDAFLPRQLNGGMEFSTTSTQSGTRIISLQVGMFSATPRVLNESITLQFPVIVNNAINPLCVFWSFNDTGSEGWSSSGLSVGSFDESTGTVICISNHLTSFAVLVDVSYPIPVDTDQDGVDDSMDPCIGCCVSDFSLGVQWPQMVQGGTARMSCSILDSSFTPGSVFTRTCFFNSLWSSVDLTSCTFSAGAANPILTHSVTGFFFPPNVTIDVFINEYSGALESAGITNATVTSLGGLQAVTEATYSSILTVEFLLETFDEDLVVTFIQSLDPRRKKRVVESIFQTVDAFGFVPSTMCTCTNVTSSEVFTSVCSGAPQNPCQCTTSSCQCVDPFVPLQETNSSSLQCSLDSEGDTIADPEDNCPDVYSIDNTCPSAQSLTGESCPEEFDEEWGFMWNQTAANTIAGQRCQLLLDGPIVSGSVTRTCSPTGEWQMVNTTQCQSQVITDVRDEILRITNLGRPLTVFEQQEVQMLSQQLDNATSESVLFPADLQSVNVYLDSVSELFENGNVLPDRGVNITTLLAISSNVLDNRFQQGWTTLNDETRPNGASQLLLNVERIASIAANAVTQAPRLPSTQAMQLDNIILDVRLVNTSDAGTDVTVGNNQVSGSNLTEEELPIITVPSEVLVPVGPSPMVPVTTVVFRNLDAFLPRQLNGGMEFSTTSTQPGTRIISLQVGMFSATTRRLNESITLQFPVIVNNAINPLCVFWSFNDTESEGWSSSGVRVGSFDESTGTVICISNHLTSFAVLVDVSGRIPPSRALSVLTYVGCGISIICLVLTVIFLISMRKDLYQKVNNFVLLNLCIALICGLIIFCAGIETASWNVIPCTIVAALLHYFFLAAFGWMLCEAVLIYNLLVKVFGAHERKWLYIFLGIGWGFPIPILIISLASRYNYYFIRASLDPSSPLYNDIRACWLSSQEGVIFAFVAPIVAIIIINTCLLIRAMYSLWKSDLGSSAQKISEKDKKASKETAIKLMKATIILMPLLGLTWLIGLLAAIPFPQPVPLILAAFFLILNTLQGAFIFFFHVVRHDRIWPKLRRMCFCIKTKKETTSTGTQSKSNKTTSTVGHSSKSRSLFNSNATQNKYSVNDHSDSIAMDSYVTANIYESEAEKKLDHTGVDAHSVQEFKIEFTDSRFGESIRR